MKEFLMPFWEFLFDAFGIFGIGIALGIVGFVIVIGLLLIGAVVAAIKALIKPSRKAQQCQAASAITKSVPSSVTTTNTQYSQPKAEYTEAPKSEAPVQKTSEYKPNTMDDYLERAEKGEPFAQCCCGSMYESSKDMEKAIYWFKKAADQGHTLSYYRLGLIYLEGRGGIEKNLDLAEEYMTCGAEGENDSAQYQLAMLYSKKNEMLCEEMGYTTREQKMADSRYTENQQKYKYWLKKAAANGNLDAEYILY